MVGTPFRAPRAAVGHADLLRALAAGGEPALAGMARLLGYQEEQRPASAAPVAQATAGPAPEPGEERSPAPAPSPAELARLPLWRLEAVERLEEPPPDASLDDATGILREDLEPTAPWPRAAPIAPWPRLWPALHRALRSSVPSRQVDTELLVDRWSRGDTLVRLPLKKTFAWSRRAIVLVDRSPRLIPVWPDQDDLCRRLRRYLGRAGLRVLRGHEGPAGPWIEHPPPAVSTKAAGAHQPPGHAPPPRLWRSLAPVVAGETVLATSDLGMYSGAKTRAAWSQLARSLDRHDARLRALVPCPAGRWIRAAVRHWPALDWSSPRHGAARAGLRPSEEILQRRCERLLTLVAPAVRIEPGLLRAVRRLLPARDADLGTELDVWSHPDVDGGSSVAMRVEPPDWRDAFRGQNAALRAAAVRQLRRWHEALPKVIWLEEALELELTGGGADGALPPEDAAEARRFALRVSRTLTRQPQDPARQAELERWFARFGQRLPEAAWVDAELGPSLARAWGVVRQGDPDLQVPSPLSPADLEPGNAPAAPRRWTAWQTASSIRFLPAEQTPGGPATSSPLATVLAARPEVHLTAATAWQRPWQLGPVLPCPLPRAPALVLRTDRERVELRRFERPPWATAAGRDRFGLWATIEVDGVSLHLRWIPPSRFWMGSPESEAGRWRDEGPRHEVTLTRGFWLGETACTQALWEAVTGKNPSRFKSPDRPVEQVSWNDCRKFLDALEKRVPGLDPKFPTEAEWEHACRAGTETSTYAGELEILGESNAPLLDKIAWYGGNSGVGFDLDNGEDSSGWPEKQFPHERAGTHPVAQKEPNAWGLYDMLGNVREWCSAYWSDSYGSPDPVQDPQGPSKGSVRVLRGGSWDYFARFVRSAYRSRYDPGIRGDYLGFRLARGQAAQPGGGATSEESRGGVRRGTRRRPSRRGSQR